MKRKTAIVISAAVLFICGFSLCVFSMPAGQTVESGIVSFEQPDPRTLNIIADDRAVINFNTFSIGEGESVNFIQPGALSSVLSRVTGGMPSEISGFLSANGMLFLVNPAGIYFSPASSVNVSTLVASTLDITTNNFIQGRYVFERGPAVPYGQVVNAGNMQGNNIVLSGSSVANTGVIKVPAGVVHLAAGDKVTLTLDPGGLIGLEIDEAAGKDVLDASSGFSVREAIANYGSIEGGQVFLSARTARDIFDRAINQSGIIKATGLKEENGVIKVVADGGMDISGVMESTGDVMIRGSGESALAGVTAGGDIVLESADRGLVIGQYPGSDISAGGSLTIGAEVSVNAGDAAYAIGRDWVNRGIFNPQESTVELVSDQPAQVIGSTEFNNFSIRVPAKSVRFEAGSTQTILGTLILQGGYGQLLSLRSTGPGEHWRIDARGPRDVQYVLAGDSINLNAAALKGLHSDSAGNLVNWDLDPYWTGAGADNYWSTADNWDTGTVPTGTSVVSFDGTTGANPNKDSSIDDTWSDAHGTIASLAIDGYSGTITQDANITITGAYTQTSGTFEGNAGFMDIGGDLTVSGGTMTAAMDTNLNVAGDLHINGGTLTGGFRVAVNGGDVTGDGLINMTGGTFLLDGTGYFGGNTDWTFFNLTFGDGVDEQTTTKVGPNAVTTLHDLTISLHQRLEAGTGTWNLSWNASGTTNHLGDISLIAAGNYHTVALQSGGLGVYAWGRNDYGQLGDGTTTTSTLPVQVLGLGGAGFLGDAANGGPITQIAAGGFHSMALTADGTRVYAWGDNYDGRLGNGTTAASDVPVRVLGVGGSGFLGDGATISHIAAGGYHSLALQSDGTQVYAWGRNSSGQLGNGTTANSSTPVRVLGVGGTGFLGDGVNGGPVSQIDAGQYRSMALKSDGTRVYAWGYNWSGQLGDGTSTSRSAPIQVLGLGGAGFLGDGVNGGPISQIAAGGYHNTALKSDGTRVYAWGWNNNGQLGDGTTTTRSTPVQVLGLGGTGFLGDGVNGGPVVQLSAGLTYSMALKSDGSRVYAWGTNSSGQLGDGTVSSRSAPVLILGSGGAGFLGDGVNGGPVASIDAGGIHSAALKSDGARVYTWGSNSYGQLGDGSFTSARNPVEVSGLDVDETISRVAYLTDISQISAGYEYTLALKSDGSRVYGWGANWNSQLGDGTTTDRSAPVQVLGLGGTGFLGDGVNGGPISQIAAGEYFSLALKSDGSRVYAWGYGGDGELGNNSTEDSAVPVEVLGLGGVGFLGDGVNGGPISQIATWEYHSLALQADGSRVYGWGSNWNGQLGDGTYDEKHVPVQVLGLGGTGFLGDGVNGGPVSQISVGYGHSLALKSDGTRVYSWGYNVCGQLGDGTTTKRNFPGEVLGLAGAGLLGDGVNGGPIVQIAAGFCYSMALKSDGTRVYAWGDNWGGALGDGTTDDRTVPVEVLGVGGAGFLGDGVNGGPIVQIAAGLDHSLALKSDGTRVYAWGYNGSGELGDGTTTDRYIPVQVVGLGGAGFLGDGVNGGPVSSIDAGAYHSLALKSDGSRIYAWGDNSSGQAGNSTYDTTSSVEQASYTGFHPLVINGTLDCQTSLFKYTLDYSPVTNLNSVTYSVIAGADYYNLEIDSPTENFILTSDITVLNNFYLNAAYFDYNGYDLLLMESLPVSIPGSAPVLSEEMRRGIITGESSLYKSGLMLLQVRLSDLLQLYLDIVQLKLQYEISERPTLSGQQVIIIKPHFVSP